MFHLSMYIGNHCHDCYLPDSEAWTSDITIPQAVAGSDRDLVMHLRSLDNCCYLLPDPSLTWQDEPHTGERQIQDRRVVRLNGRNGTLTIVPDQCTVDATAMGKYRVPGREIIRIGRDMGCHICQRSEFMSDFHGELQSVSEQEGYYTDHSKNGSFVNGARCQNQRVTLRYGDVISLGLGLRIVWLGSVIAVNNAPYLEHVNLPGFVPQVPNMTALSRTEHPASSVGQYHRAPRILQPSEVREIKIEGPMSKSDPNEQPLILSIGPSATMVVPMLLSSIVGGRNMASMLVMMGGSAILAVMWGMLNFDYRKKNRGITEEKRQQLYHRYIAEQEEELLSLAEQELSRMNEQFLSVDRCLELPVSTTHRLWERMATHSDFTAIRLGRGQVRLPAEITIPDNRLEMIEDELRDEPRRLLETYEHINDAPITLQLRDWPIIGVLSPRNRPQMLQSMVMQLAATHSYHDVRIAVLCKEDNLSQWSWARWLPHSFANESRTLRMVVSKPNAIHEVITYLENILFVRKELAGDSNASSEGPVEQQLPHYFIFCTDPALIENLPIMRHLMEGQLGFTLVLQASSMERLPKECRVIIQAGEQQGAVYGADGNITNVFYEYPSLDSLIRFSHQIAPIRVRDTTGSSAIPTLVTFMDIYHARRVEELDVWRFWSEHHAWEGIQSTIGLRSGSQPFVLDISDKQQSHGPHGLVAGTTGSGKSVMLQTYILSLALNYHPSQVQFILIDYKGGGTANVFKDLPHVAGIIDNQQEERTIQRALKSIQGEINRRERIFKRLGIDHIDDYIQYYNNDPAEKPLAHIIIVVDEFAELKHEQPEFMKALVSAARVGRSVGLHLILATQKPSNSVDDEIWSNTRFHICLRVASRADSNDMLKRPDAAYLRGMGRCYVQVGNDEIFEQVQTSYSGAEYNPDALTSEEMPHLLNDAGQPIRIKKKKKNPSDNDKAETQMDAVMERIIAVSRQHGVKPTPQLWLDEMASVIPLEQLEGFKPLAFDGEHWHNQDADTLLIPYGLMDDVADQCYVPMSINLSADHNVMIVAPAASGKTTMIQTLAMSLAMLYTPDQVSLYILSLTSNTLGVLRDLPHVGEIVMANEVDEISRLLQLIISEDNRRRALFEELNTSNFAQYNVAARRTSGYEPLPAVVVMIDRFAQLIETLKEDQFKALQKLLMEAASHGIYFIVTALSLAKEEMPFKMVSAFRGIGFQLPDRDLYKQVMGTNTYISPDQMDISAVPGRGLGMIRSGNDVGSGICEVQAAIFGGIQEDFERSELIAETAARMNKAWTGARPQGIVRIPKDFQMQHMLELPECSPASHPVNVLPIAVRKAQGSPVLYDLANQSVLSITGAPRSGKTNMLLVIADMVCRQGGRVYLFGVNSALQSFAEAHPDQVVFHSSADTDGCIEAVLAIKDLLHDRSVELAGLPKGDAAARAAFIASSKPIAVLIDDVGSYIDANPSTLKWLGGASANSMGAGLNTLFAITCSHQDMARMRPKEPVNAICNHPIGIALGGRLTDCMPWNISVGFELKKFVCPVGEALYINGSTVEQILIPQLGE